ncbi:MAG: hypothetical protein ACI9BK_003613, partial [Acidimicrobiales bacterium]
EDPYSRALPDDRHADIICLGTKPASTHLMFPDWSMT